MAKGYACPFWLKFKQAQQLGGNVRKGEHGELVVYADRITRSETDENGAESERSIPFMKGYTVSNAEQCEGLPAHLTTRPDAPALPLTQRIEWPTGSLPHRRRHPARRNPRLLRRRPGLRTDAALRDLQGRRKYRRHAFTRMCALEQAREAPRPRFRPHSYGDEGYAREALVAELGSASPGSSLRRDCSRRCTGRAVQTNK